MHLLTITDIQRETPDTVSLKFHIPDNLKESYQFIPGQYVFVQKEIEGKILKRAYSITASPFSGVLQITVKETPTGEFSKYVNSQLKVGDTLEVSAPKGNFVLPVKQENAKNYLAFATGSGIAPIYAMILTVLEKEPKSKFGLIYGNSTPEYTIFKEALENLQTTYPNRFYLQFVYSQEVIPGTITGRINSALVKYAIEKGFGDVQWEQFYICGQEEMKEQISTTLSQLGIDDKQVFFELFTKPKKADEVKMTIVLDGEQKEIKVNKKTTILDAAIRAGLDPSYSCQGGFCTSCVAKVTQGQAEMEENATLYDDELAEGKVLTCVARATTDTIHITYDI